MAFLLPINDSQNTDFLRVSLIVHSILDETYISLVERLYRN